FDGEAVPISRPGHDCGPSRLRALLDRPRPGDEYETTDIVSTALRHDCLQYVLLELAGRVGQTKGHLHDGRFVRKVEVHRERRITAEPSFAVICPKLDLGSLPKYPQELVGGPVAAPRAQHLLEIWPG